MIFSAIVRPVGRRPAADCAAAWTKGVVGVAPRLPVRPEVGDCHNRLADGSGRSSPRIQLQSTSRSTSTPRSRTARDSVIDACGQGTLHAAKRGRIDFDHTPIVTDEQTSGTDPGAESRPFGRHRGRPEWASQGQPRGRPQGRTPDHPASHTGPARSRGRNDEAPVPT